MCLGTMQYDWKRILHVECSAVDTRLVSHGYRRNIHVSCVHIKLATAVDRSSRHTWNGTDRWCWLNDKTPVSSVASCKGPAMVLWSAEIPISRCSAVVSRHPGLRLWRQCQKTGTATYFVLSDALAFREGYIRWRRKSHCTRTYAMLHLVNVSFQTARRAIYVRAAVFIYCNCLLTQKTSKIKVLIFPI